MKKYIWLILSVPGSDEDPYSTHINYSPAQAKPYGSPAHPPRGNSQPSQSSQPFQPSAQGRHEKQKWLYGSPHPYLLFICSYF